MAIIQNINVSTPNDGLGDSLRDSQVKANSNFAELNTKKVEVQSGFGLSENNFTDAEQSKLAGIEAGANINVQPDWQQEDPDQDDYIKNRPTFEDSANKQNSMAVDGFGVKYPTVDAVNSQVNSVARSVLNVGLIDVSADAFQMARADDTHLNITGTSIGVVFPNFFDSPPYAPVSAVKQVPTNTNYPLQNFLSSLPTSTTQGVFFIGWRDSTQDFELSTTSFVQNPNVFHCGVIFLKNVAGVISFIDSTRTVITMPDVSQYSNLETTAIGVKSNVFISPNNGGMTVKNNAGTLVGLSVNYKGQNNDEKAIAVNATTSFRRLNPGNANATSLPAAGTTVVTTDRWNGTAMVALTNNGSSSVQRWLLTVMGTFILQPGEAEYTNYQEGRDNVYTATFTDIIPKGTFLEIGRLVAIKTTSNLGDVTQAVFVGTGSGSSGGGTASSVSFASITGLADDNAELFKKANKIVGGTATQFTMADGTAKSVGSIIKTRKDITGGYTLLASDVDKILYTTSATDFTITVPSGLPTGQTYEVLQYGAGKPSYIVSGTTLVYSSYAQPKHEEINTTVIIEWVDTEKYKLYGELSAY